MNNYWKAALAGAGAIGLMAMTGGAAAPGLAALLGGAGEGAAAAGGAAAAAGAGEAAVAGGAAAAGAAGAEAAGAAGAAAAGTGAAGAGAAGAAGAEAAGTAAAASPTAFVSQPVTGLLSGAGDLSGSLAGTDLGYGTAASNGLLAPGGAASGGTGGLSGSLAETNMGYGGAAMANAPSAAPSALQQAGMYAKAGNRAFRAYNGVTTAMGGNQPQAQAPAPHPVFQGQGGPIAPGMMTPQQNQFAQMLLAQRQRGMLG